MNYLLARVENFTRFDGESLYAKPLMGYGKSGEAPHEKHNFTIATDGLINGYLPKEGGGDLRRLGRKPNAVEIPNVTVVFISNGFLCGYYRNATALGSPIRHPDRFNAGDSEIYCRVKVDPNNAFLITVEKRINRIKPRPRGQFPVLYGDSKSDWVKWFEAHILGGSNLHLNEKKRRRWTAKIERCSKAREMALKNYGFKCEVCKVSHEDDVRTAIFEVHHKVPFSKNYLARNLKVSDLAVLCANCHRMIHKMPDVADVEALRGYIEPN